MILGFIVAHIAMVAIMFGYAVPRYYDVLIPIDRRNEGSEPTIAMQTKGELAGRPVEEIANAERGVGAEDEISHSSHEKKTETAKLASKSSPKWWKTPM
jgi:solute carrier family 6 (neurotransmitter transporter, GABA) member 1